MPLLITRLIMNSESSAATTTTGTYFVRRFRIRDLTDSPFLPVVLNLLDMHYYPGEFHAIMEHHSPTLFLQVL